MKFWFLYLMLLSTQGIAGTILPNSWIKFTSNQMGVNVQGGFSKVSGQVDIDSKSLLVSKAQVKVDLLSVNAGSPDATNMLADVAWFNSKQYREAQFVLTSVKPLAQGQYEASGNMTIKSKTVPVTATFTVKSQGAQQQIDGSFKLSRLSFAIGDGVWKDTSTVGDEVKLTFQFLVKP